MGLPRFLRQLTSVSGLLLVCGSFALPVLAQEPPPGMARMEVRITESDEDGPIETVISYLMPVDGERHEFQQGRQMAVQTKMNFVPTLTFLDATTRVTARLTPYLTSSATVMQVQGAVQDVHIMEELGLPFVLAEDSMLDTLSCVGNWFVTNRQERMICSSAREGGESKSWTVTMIVQWNSEFSQADELDIGGLATTEATMVVSRRTGKKWQSISCDDLAGEEISSCESQHGKQVPLVTIAGDTQTTTFIDATTRISISVHGDGKSELEMLDTTMEPPPSVQKIDLGVLGTARALYTVPSSASTLENLRVATLTKSGEGEVSITLEKYRRIVPTLAAQ